MTTDDTVKTRTGRPSIGRTVALHVPPALLAEIDAEAARRGESRAETMRRRLAAPPGAGEVAEAVRSVYDAVTALRWLLDALSASDGRDTA